MKGFDRFSSNAINQFQMGVSMIWLNMKYDLKYRVEAQRAEVMLNKTTNDILSTIYPLIRCSNASTTRQEAE